LETFPGAHHEVGGRIRVVGTVGNSRVVALARLKAGGVEDGRIHSWLKEGDRICGNIVGEEWENWEYR